MTIHGQVAEASPQADILLDWKRQAGLVSPTRPMPCKLTVRFALQLDSHNVLPLLRLSNYYEVSPHLHRYAPLQLQAESRLTGRLGSATSSVNGPSLVCSHAAALVPLLTGL